MLFPEGSTYFPAWRSSPGLQPAGSTTLPLVLCNSIQSGKPLPLVTTPALSDMISFSRTDPRAGGTVRLPGEPLLLALARQFAGSSGSANGSITSSDGPLPSGAVGQPFLRS